MSVKSGAGASVSSGADYQARVAAYLIALALCDVPIEHFDLSSLASIGFETAEPVDDINLSFAEGRDTYLQVKRKINFSTLTGSDFHGVIQQFVKQQSKHSGRSTKFTLVTTSASSKKITSEMKAALEAFRLGDEEAFRRDQPRESVSLIDVLLTLVGPCIASGTAAEREKASKDLLRRMYVLILDLDEASSLEQAVVMVLHSRMFVLPEELWRKVITDCLNHAAQRHTISTSQLRSRYETYKIPMASGTPKEDSEFLKASVAEYPLSTGREIILGTLLDADGSHLDKLDLVICELARFDDACKERVTFKDGTCYFTSGMQVLLKRRTATYAGMTRFIESRPDLIEGRTVTLIPMNAGDEDIEKSLCAERQRRLLNASYEKNEALFTCAHCAKPVSSADAELIEDLVNGEPRVGITHSWCTRVDDRVLGIIKSEFFEKYAYLNNFDVNLWFRLIQKGQGAFAFDKYPVGATFVWSGTKPALVRGDYILELCLERGESEFSFHRGAIQRFSKAEADAKAQEFIHHLAEGKSKGDVYCLSDQTKCFGTRSVLLSMLGVSERLREIIGARVVKFDQKIAARYALWENWYAPVVYLCARDDGSLINFGGCIPIITDPLSLDRYIENWKSSEIVLPEYEVVIIESDRAFDDLVSGVTDDDFTVIVDPLFQRKDGRLKLESGRRLVPMAQILNENQKPG